MTRAEAGSLGGRARWRGTTAQQRSAHMRHARRHVSSEACRRNGRRGYQVTAERHGRDVATRKAREWRLDNPSRPESAVLELLVALGQEEGIDFLREYEEPFTANGAVWMDFAWPGAGRAIEVLGHIHRAGLDPDRPKRDAERLAQLRALGWDILTLDESSIPHAAIVIAAFLDLEVPV